MALLKKLKKKEVHHTVFFVSGHPASLATEEVKEAYLCCVCVICYADEVFKSAERQAIRDLAESLQFPIDKLSSLFEFASDPDEEILDKRVAMIARSNLVFPCLADMALISYIDGQFCEETESAYLDSFSKEWNINGNVSSKILSLARAVYGGRIDQAENELKKKFFLDPSELESIQAWVAALKKSCVPISPAEEKRSVAMKVSTEKKTSVGSKKQPSAKSSKINEDVEKVDSFKIEVLSQLGKLKQLLGELTQNDGSFKQSKEFETISSDLQSELAKVEDLRMTLAFVGTMKAGKSTTINAVVGSNVLPNRSGAMTTLPTLITHVKSRTVPSLIFNKKEPFDTSIKKINAYCKKNKIKKGNSGQLYKKTLDRILTNNLKELKTNYKGQQEIYTFMESMNDIVRICAEFELESPLSSYTSIEDFPEIEVEFAYLADREGNCTGRLSLIDTPGPNEAGQSGLKGVVKEQLAKASTIVCVAEPTQVDSEAQAEIRDWIQGAQKTSGAPLFVLLNKIDTMPCGERNAEIFEERALRLFPDFENIEGNSVSIRGRVYGISSHQALLANMASYSLRAQGRLPHWQSDMWVKDFLEKGGWYQDDPPPLENSEWITSRSQRLWEGSMMQKPLENIIIHSMHQAVPLCLSHALDFVSRNSREIQNVASVRQGALGLETTKLETLIKNLQGTKNKIEGLKKELEGIQEKSLGECVKKLKAALTGTSAEVMAVLKNKANEENEENQKKADSPWGFMALHFNGDSNLLNKLLLGDEVIKRHDLEDIDKLIANVTKMASKLNRKAADQRISECESFLNQQRTEFATSVETKLQPILDDINALLHENFSLTLTFPKMAKTKLQLDLDIAVQKVVKTEEYKDYYTERNPWTLFIFKRKVWFTATRHIIDPCDFRKALENDLIEVTNKASDLLQRTIGDQFLKDLTLCFTTADETVARVQSSIEQSVLDKGQAEEKQESIRCQFIALADKSKKLSRRSEKTKESLNLISEGNGYV